MIRSSFLSLLSVCILAVSIIHGVKAQKPVGAPKSGSEMLYAPSESETLGRIQNQLLGALAMLESMDDNGSQDPLINAPMKTAEKRRNKFEFIRFGRK